MRYSILRVTEDGKPDRSVSPLLETDSASELKRWEADNYPRLHSEGTLLVCQTKDGRTYFKATRPNLPPKDAYRYQVFYNFNGKDVLLYHCATSSQINEWKRTNFPILRRIGALVVTQTKDDRRYVLRTDYEDALERRLTTIESLLSSPLSSI